MATLTGANAVLMLGVAGLFSTPQRLQGFSAEDIFDVEQIKLNEVLMGVDGILSGGMVFNPTSQTINLQSDSASISIFDQWVQAQLAAVDSLKGNMQVSLPGLGVKFNMPKGFLTDYPPMPSVGKQIKPRKYTIMWETVTPSPA